MLELGLQGVNDTEVVNVFKGLIHEYVPKESDFAMISPFGDCDDSLLTGKWNMFKDEIVTAGSNSLEADDTKFFWAKMLHRYSSNWLLETSDFNDYLKGGVNSEVISYNVDIPYTSSRPYLKFFLSVDCGEETETLESLQDSDIFSNVLVKVRQVKYRVVLICTHIYCL